MKTPRTLAPACVVTLAALLIAASAGAATVPAVSSANLTYHIDAHDMFDNGGTTAPVDGANVAVTGWKELTTGAGLNIQSTPTYIASSINGGPAVRFDGGPSGSDLVYSNNAAIVNTSAQTIFVVTTMASDGYDYSALISNTAANINVRQGVDASAAYFTGNSADFHSGGGSFTINGGSTFTVDGGFGSAHVVRSISPTVKNINSLRIGDNANNRVWAGDVAEVLVFDGKLSADDTARVNLYLGEKYALPQVVDEATSNTSQVATDPIGGIGSQHVAVNFHYNGPTVGTTFKGIGFDNVNVATLPTGPIVLNANAKTAGATLSIAWNGFTLDNGQRTQSAGFTGSDAATLNAVANEMFYLSESSIGGTDHHGVTMTFGGLKADSDTFVQLLGGDSGWNGDVQVDVNGQSLAWDTIANGSGATGSLFGFWATTDSSGQLEFSLSVYSGNFAGIGGVIVSQVAPTPGALPAGLAMIALVAARRRR